MEQLQSKVELRMPKPRDNENRAEFLARCMRDDEEQRLRPDPDARLARCVGIWESERVSTPNEKLLAAIQGRKQKQTEFRYGILTADRYVKTMQQCVGTDLCYRYAAKGAVSFNDCLQKAACTLVYSNQDMKIVDHGSAKQLKRITQGTKLSDSELRELLPKNTLQVFRHVLTTPRKDRDGDVLRTEGAVVDPKMLLLWQHVHTLPIGKMLAISEHSPDRLVLVSAIVDLNEMSHDAAVMVDNDMARFSHGFRALEFDELKAEEGETTTPGGFDVKRFEIMEESIVSVPSNVDAEVEERTVELIEKGKLKSDLMAEYGRTIRQRMPLQVAVTEEIPNENEPGSGSEEAGREKQGCSCTPEKADAESRPREEQKETEGTKVGRDYLRACKAIEDSLCNDCVRMAEEVAEKYNAEHAATFFEATNVVSESLCKSCRQVVNDEYYEIEEKMVIKAGRALSRRNMEALMEVKDDLEEMKGMDLPRACRAMCERCIGKLKMVIGPEYEEEEERATAIDAEKALSLFLAQATEQQQRHAADILRALETARESSRKADKYRTLIGKIA